MAALVWSVEEGGRPLAQTGANSGKIKRIPPDPRVMIAPLWRDRAVAAEPVPAVTELLPAAEIGRVQQLLARKYRIDLIFIKPIRCLQSAFRRGQPPARR